MKKKHDNNILSTIIWNVGFYKKTNFTAIYIVLLKCLLSIKIGSGYSEYCYKRFKRIDSCHHVLKFLLWTKCKYATLKSSLAVARSIIHLLWVLSSCTLLPTGVSIILYSEFMLIRHILGTNVFIILAEICLSINDVSVRTWKEYSADVCDNDYFLC